jgi:diaminopimelate decarboxylase
MISDPNALERAIHTYGSPIHIHCAEPFRSNIASFTTTFSQAGVRGRVFYARKANAYGAFAKLAAIAGAGVDVASHYELKQTLEMGVHGKDMILTASAKGLPLLQDAVDAGVCIVLDNWTELERLKKLTSGRTAEVMIRLSDFTFQQGAKSSRFGFPFSQALQVVDSLGSLNLRGFQFHLDGYSCEERVLALEETLPLFERCRRRDRRPTTLDIGGGFPVRYLEKAEQFQEFLAEVLAAQSGARAPFNYRNDALAITTLNDKPIAPRLYPFASPRPKHEFLEDILDSKLSTGCSVAEAIRERDIELCVEPGRALLDGAGVTISSVSHDKRVADGSRYVTLDMNQTQCRAVSLEFCVDPVWVGTSLNQVEPGYLTGDTCMESDLILRRMVDIPSPLSEEAMVLFPNTAGYHMHLFQNPGHREALPKNFGWSRELGLTPGDL